MYLCVLMAPDCEQLLCKQVRLQYMMGEIRFVDIHVIASLLGHKAAIVLSNTDGGRQMAGLTDRQREPAGAKPPCHCPPMN
jgi:hypothetical protein